jgi:hypothetical protein
MSSEETRARLMEALEERLWPEEQGAHAAHALGA